MNKFTQICVGIIVSASCCQFLISPVLCQTNHTADIAAIRNSLHAMDLACDKRDAKGYCAYSTSDFVGADNDGKVIYASKAERQKQTVGLFNAAHRVHMMTTINQITFNGNTAVLSESIRGEIDMTLKGQQRKIMLNQNCTDTWVKNSAKQWREKSLMSVD